MSATLIERTEHSLTLQVTIPLAASMLASERRIQSALNEAGCLATGAALERFDTDGAPLVMGASRWTSKGQEPKAYQTPYGEQVVSRHVYQTSSGGKTYCPLERDGRIVVTSTPMFAQQIAHKFAEMSSPRVQQDLTINHGRATSRSFLQDVAQAVGSAAQAKEESWHYQTPKLNVPIETISIGMDGTCMLLCEEGYRQAMVGTISLYDGQGERQHTTYIGATPEYGQAQFIARLEREIAQVKGTYPEAYTMGLADGAPENWAVLAPHTQDQVLDFYHATGYLATAAAAAFPRHRVQRAQWLEERAHQLKHKQGAATRLLSEMETLAQGKLSGPVRQGLEAAITYFRNHTHQMNYARHLKANRPIGSGVTEAACKTIVKQRLGHSGMKWKEQGARIVLSLRTLTYTPGRWEQFWHKIDRYGFPLAA
jgi:hypothetical protein